MKRKKLIMADPTTGKPPTKKQLEILLLLNPFEHDITYEDAAKTLGVDKQNIKATMSRFKTRCPVIYKRFKKLWSKNKYYKSMEEVVESHNNKYKRELRLKDVLYSGEFNFNDGFRIVEKF